MAMPQWNLVNNAALRQRAAQQAGIAVSPAASAFPWPLALGAVAAAVGAVWSWKTKSLWPVGLGVAALALSPLAMPQQPDTSA